MQGFLPRGVEGTVALSELLYMWQCILRRRVFCICERDGLKLKSRLSGPHRERGKISVPHMFFAAS